MVLPNLRVDNRQVVTFMTKHLGFPAPPAILMKIGTGSGRTSAYSAENGRRPSRLVQHERTEDRLHAPPNGRAVQHWPVRVAVIWITQELQDVLAANQLQATTASRGPLAPRPTGGLWCFFRVMKSPRTDTLSTHRPESGIPSSDENVDKRIGIVIVWSSN